MIGELIDHYRVLELLGRGAMGVVYKALDENLDRQVAIKVMSAEARNDPDFVERFRQEARLQGALNHPNVAMLFDYFIHDGTPVAVMELIDGESFEQLIKRRGAIPAHQAIPIFRQALRGVAAAHRAGIVHRDLKPSNLMVTRDELVKVMDFGIAKRQGSPGATKVSSTSIGSPLYMAPEQILGRAVDCRTDVYALGLTLYELLSGNKPFNPRGKAEFMVLNAHVNDLPEPPTVYRYGIPQPLVDAVMRALAKDPAARFQSAEEFLGALPDVPAPKSAAHPGEPGITPAVAARVGPTGTVAIAPPPAVGAGPTGTVLLERPPASSATTVLEYSPPPTGTTVLEYAPSPGEAHTATLRLDAGLDLNFDIPGAVTAAPAQTVRLAPSATPVAASPREETPAPRAPAAALRGSPPASVQRPRAHYLGLVAAVIAALAVGGLLLRTGQQPPMQADSDATPAPAPTVVEAAVPPPPAVPEPAADAPVASAGEVASASAAPAPASTVPAPATAAEPAAAVPATAAPPLAAVARARPDLSGIWRGAYVDASGKQRLRVVNLSISRVHHDGGIEGTLQYQTAAGVGECQLHPRGSSYSALAQRLQLSPEGCSAHYPKELGVPLDFSGVNPQADTLRNGRIEAPTGEVIRVKLQRVSGV